MADHLSLWQQPERLMGHWKLPGALGSSLYHSKGDGMFFSWGMGIFPFCSLTPICKPQSGVVWVPDKCLLSDGQRLVLLSLTMWYFYIF